MSVFSTASGSKALSRRFDRAAGAASNEHVPSYVVTAEDRDWFARCRRAWDFGAVARSNLEPVPPTGRADALVEAVRAALAVHYFPGMWTWDRAIVEPLVLAAFDRAGGPDRGRELVEAFQRWAPTADGFTPVRVEADVEVFVPDPEQPERGLLSRDGAPVRYRDRVALAVIDDDKRSWLGEHRVVDAFADEDDLVLDERSLTACWAWEQVELATAIAGVQYTELRLDPPAFRRTAVPRSAGEKAATAARLGRAVRAMLDPEVTVDPSPAWSHCARCAFRAPCIMINRGDDARPALARYRRRPDDVIEEGRLGGTSWGLGRGAAPRRFG